MASERFRVLGNRVAWAFVPFMALGQAIQVALPVPGLSWLSFEVVVFGIIAALTSPWWWRRRHELTPTARTAMVAFLGLLAYAVASLLLHPPPEVISQGGGPVPRIYVAVPLLSALFAMLGGVGFVLAAERHLRLRILSWGALASLVVAYVGWPFQAAYRDYVRLATGQGGAAIIHVLFLLIVAIGLAQFLRGKHRRLALVVVLGGLGAIIATQSRAAVISVGAWVLLLAVGWLVRRPQDARRLWPLGAAVAVAAMVVALLPGLDRMLSFEEPKRAENLQTALAIWTSDAPTVLWGTGPGQLWPWWAYESGLYPMPEGVYWSVVTHPQGDLLLTPHSTPLVILTELGIPGALLALLVAVCLTVGWWRSRTALPRLVVASAALACLAAFLVDTYLLRNFGISMWWWAIVALVSTWHDEAVDP